MLIIYNIWGNNMVKVILDLSQHEIDMLYHCIETALDVKPMNKEEKKTASLILDQLRKYDPRPIF
jgi:membrane-bound inhibitor of C-type lysozyme